MSPHTPIESSWRQFDMTEYRLEMLLTSYERTALASSHSRSGMLRMKPAPDLIRPLTYIAPEEEAAEK